MNEHSIAVVALSDLIQFRNEHAHHVPDLWGKKLGRGGGSQLYNLKGSSILLYNVMCDRG